MSGRNGIALFKEQCRAGKQVCVGLDGDVTRMPHSLLRRADEDTPGRHPMYLFSRAIVEATKDVAGCFKPNSAFFEAGGWRGMRALEELVAFIHQVAPEVPVIGDLKRGDIGPTNQQYGRASFDVSGFDALTINGWPGLRGGLDALLTEWPDKLFFVLCRTSNPGAGDFQDRVDVKTGLSMWQLVATTVRDYWNDRQNCGLVVGATYPEDLDWVRSRVGNMPILSPGLGTQGGDLVRAVRAGGPETVFNNSSGIIYRSSGLDFAKAAAAAASEMDQAIRAVQNS